MHKKPEGERLGRPHVPFIKQIAYDDAVLLVGVVGEGISTSKRPVDLNCLYLCKALRSGSSPPVMLLR
jgi:hypothetical protein